MHHHLPPPLPPAGNIYQRRGAKRWKKIKRVNGHAFVPRRFANAYCAICDDRIWGLGRQVGGAGALFADLQCCMCV